jgi:hypothetical protein
MAQPKIATPDVEQPLRGALGEDATVLRGSDEIADEQASSATLTMQYRGLEQAIPLHLSSEDIGELALEAQVREISLGQLLATLIEAAMAEGLSRVLDDKSSGQSPK